MKPSSTGREPLEALLLDLDRTLVDVQTFTDYGAALEDVDRELGSIEVRKLPETAWASATRRAMGVLVSLADDPVRWERASAVIEAHELAAVPRASPMPGLAPFLEATAQIPRAVVTLMGGRAMDAVCERFEIDVAVRVSRQSGFVPKPAPDQVLAACLRLGVDPAQATMLGDSSWDEAAAIAAGTGFLGLTNDTPSEFSAGTTIVTDLPAALEALGL